MGSSYEASDNIRLSEEVAGRGEGVWNVLQELMGRLCSGLEELLGFSIDLDGELELVLEFSVGSFKS